MIRMTSNTTPNPYVASASSEVPNVASPFANGLAFQVFTRDPNHSWTAVGGSAWVQIDAGLGFTLTISQYTIGVEEFSTQLFPDRTPSDWRILGSQDAVSWDVLDTQIGQNWGSFGVPGPVRRSYTCDVDIATPYRFLRMDISANHGSIYTSVTAWDFGARFDHFY